MSVVTLSRLSAIALSLLAAGVAGCGAELPLHAESGEMVPAAEQGAARRPRASAPAAAPDSREPTATPWLDFSGTSIVGFGILRLVPPPGGPGRFRIRYTDRPDGYTITDNTQLFVLPGDAFAERPMVYADAFLAFERTPPSEARAGDGGYGAPPGGTLELETELAVAVERTVLVAYGPWTGPDTGRPPGDEHTFTLAVEALDAGGGWEWLESEAGELITTNWTGREGVARGAPATDPVSGSPTWIEVRPLILYDAAFARARDEEPGAEPRNGAAAAARRLTAEAAVLAAAGRTALAQDHRERAADLLAAALRADRRIVLTPALAKRFRRVPIRWR